MTLAIFFLVAAIAAVIIAYPLLPGRTPAQPAPTLTDGDIDRAVRNLRRARSQDGHFCQTCGSAYREGDLFCVGCGSALPVAKAVSDGLVCPSCGISMQKGDKFCAKCGHGMAAGEVA
jgi:predicted amidophosphoribosyltransferase